jgi:hypothetical protein
MEDSITSSSFRCDRSIRDLCKQSFGTQSLGTGRQSMSEGDKSSSSDLADAKNYSLLIVDNDPAHARAWPPADRKASSDSIRTPTIS